MINEEDILSLDEIVEKYGDNMKKGEYNNEIIENMSATILDHYNVILNNYEDRIRNIYSYITAVKKIDAPRGDVGSIIFLAENILCLKNDMEFYLSSDEYKENLCNKAYKYISEESSYSRYFDKEKEIEEDYKSIHLLDLKYHLNNFKKYCTNREFLDLANNDIWRYF